jgi:hypothetical protein
MPWKGPLASVILAMPWTAPLAGVATSLMLAMTAQDFSLIVGSVAAGLGAGAAGLAKGYAIWKEASDKSIKTQLDDIQAQFVDAKRERDQLREENQELKVKLAERDRARRS